jgi:hypothetical protein
MNLVRVLESKERPRTAGFVRGQTSFSKWSTRTEELVETGDDPINMCAIDVAKNEAKETSSNVQKR